MRYFFEHFGASNEEVYQIYQMDNFPFPPHLHRAYELAYVRRGSLELRIDQKKYVLEPGELAFIACNQIHSYTPLVGATSDTFVSVLIFSPDFIGDFHQAYKGFAPVNNVIRAPEWLKFSDEEGVYRKKGMLYLLCDRLLSATRMEPAGDTLHASAVKVFDYIDSHYFEECTLQTAAKALRYDYKYLSRVFAKYAGVSFTQYLNNYRVSQACAMLRGEKMTVSEIADRCGYENLRTFHRNFKMFMNCSPQAYAAYISTTKTTNT